MAGTCVKRHFRFSYTLTGDVLRRSCLSVHFLYVKYLQFYEKKSTNKEPLQVNQIWNAQEKWPKHLIILIVCYSTFLASLLAYFTDLGVVLDVHQDILWTVFPALFDKHIGYVDLGIVLQLEGYYNTWFLIVNVKGREVELLVNRICSLVDD